MAETSTIVPGGAMAQAESAASTAVPTKQHPGAIVLDSVQYLRNGKGHLVPLSAVRPEDQLQDELVRKIMAYGEDLQAEIGRYKAHVFADIGAFDALLAQKYGAETSEETRGNRTLSTYDGSLQIKVRLAERMTFGPELQQAKALLDQMIQERAGSADPFLVALVNQAFNVGTEGRVDVASILALRRMEFDDPRWSRVCQAIDEAKRPDGTKQYVTLHRRKEQPQKGYDLVAIDLAAVEPTPEAMARPSLRRTVEGCREAMEAAVQAVCEGRAADASAALYRVSRLLGCTAAPMAWGVFAGRLEEERASVQTTETAAEEGRSHG